MTTEKNKIKKQYIEGTISITARGGGFVDSGDKKSEDILISPADLGTALHNDLVRVLLHPPKSHERQSGEVVEIISRARKTFVGTVKKENGVFLLKLQDIKIHIEIIIPEERLGKAKVGEKVLARITKWDAPGKNPTGEVLEVIGKAGVHETEMQALVRDKGFDIEFPPDVEKEANQIERDYPMLFKKEESSRRDLRGTPTFTIDPEDAKDFDDALSFKKLSEDLYEVGIHIADVSFFVTPGSALDKEAAKRGTSIYLVDRTIPMLPEVLSNNLASLKPDEDRLAFSAIFEMDSNGVVKKRWFGKSIIRSVKRFTYATAQTALDTKKGKFAEELALLDSIALKLREKRIAAGALTFEQEEIKFELDSDGKPIRIFKKERLETMKLIEDFMILANVEVATFASQKDKRLEEAFIYRVHDIPNKDRMKELVLMLRALGYEVPKNFDYTHQEALNKLFALIEPVHENLVETAAIQAMSKAIYSTKNIGHFGLSLENYTHFTSPIRRYPDLIVHRLLGEFFEGKLPEEDELHEYEAISRLSSQLEVAAQDAERGSIKLKQAEYMSRFIGGIREGVITGLIKNGIFVRENETLAEGMINLRDLKDDYYKLDETKFRIIGEKKKKTYTIGDKIRIKIKRVDLERRLIDYTIA